MMAVSVSQDKCLRPRERRPTAPKPEDEWAGKGSLQEIGDPGRLRGLVDMKSYREAGPRFLQVHPRLRVKSGPPRGGDHFVSRPRDKRLSFLVFQGLEAGSLGRATVLLLVVSATVRVEDQEHQSAAEGQ